uniref:Uncharacterized protein n=1 Tax=Glossina austeni TaxID=7395 RepID=A0A1A9UD36_GLOAU
MSNKRKRINKHCSYNNNPFSAEPTYQQSKIGNSKDHREVNLDLNSSDKDSIKTLGLLWQLEIEHLCVKTKLEPAIFTAQHSAKSDFTTIFASPGLLARVVMGQDI